MKKKIVALFLIVATLTGCLAGCSVDLEDKGPVVQMYLTTEPLNLDPAVMIYDKNTIKYTGVMFEGLTKINNNRVEKNAATEWWTDYNEEKNEYKLTIRIGNSKWNDGRVLSADQFAWAWKRILSPETNSPAAALLYDIKNAKAAKAGEVTIDNVGIAAVSQTLLEIEFEKPVDAELFLETIASPALFPVRDDVAQTKADTWATEGSDDMLSNGAFALKGRKNQGLYRLEMSSYYKGQNTVEEGFMKYVTPYRLLTDYTFSLDEQLELFDKGDIYYVGELSKENYASRQKELVTQDLLSSYTYFFDCANPALSDASVRKALSDALDRTQIAEIIGRGAKPATGFVTNGVFGNSMGSSFRNEGGDLYNTKAVSTSVSKRGSFSITYRTDRDYDKAVAEYAKSVWENMGFRVTLVGLDRAEYAAALVAGDWDVIGLDYQGLTTSAYSYLAPFATRYSGSPVSVDDDSLGYTPHVTNFENSEYDALMDSVLEALNRSDRAKLLHQIEEKFVELCPATALVFYTDYYLVSGELKNLRSNHFGYRDFSSVTLNNYKAINEVYYSVQESVAESSNAAANLGR